MTSLQSYVLSEAREGLVGMNKEGLVSFPGYLSIYFIGISTGQHILPALRTRVRSSITSEARRQAELALVLFGYAVAWWVVVLAVLGAGGQVSRRMVSL
jgi:phosphatidylinositol glycan class W